MVIYTKKVSVGAFLKRGIDFKDGDLLEIANEGKQVEGNFGMQNIFLLKIGEIEGNVSFNQMTMNGLIDGYGPDSLKWIGNKVKAVKVKMNIGGEFKDVYFFSHPDAELTEAGFVLPGTDKPVGKIKAEDIPVIDVEEEEIDVKNIPF